MHFYKEVGNQTSSTYTAISWEEMTTQASKTAARESLLIATLSPTGENRLVPWAAARKLLDFCYVRVHSARMRWHRAPRFWAVNYHGQSTVKLLQLPSCYKHRILACTNNIAVPNGNPWINIYDFCLSSGTPRKWSRDRWYRQAFQLLRQQGCVLSAPACLLRGVFACLRF